MPVVSIILVMVLHALLNTSLSHFIVEQEGNNEAKASMGLSRSTLLTFARSIREMAPNSALMLR